MNRIFSIVCLFIMLIVTTSCERNFESYIGKDINTFIEENPGYTDLWIGEGKPGYAKSLNIEYPDSTSIELLPDSFCYMNQFDEKMRWDIQLFKKEKISRIIIYKNDSLIKTIPQ